MGGLPASFFELIETSTVPVLVDFWAEWCQPCKAVSPAVGRLAREYKGRLLAVKINVDRKPGVAARYEVEAIPTIMLFWKGESVMRLQGARPYADLRAALEAHWPKGLHGDSGAEQQRQGPYGNSRAEGPQQRQGQYGNSRAEGPQQRQGQ